MFSLLSLLFLLSVSQVRPGPSAGCGQEMPAQPQPGRHHRLAVAVSDPGLGEVTRQSGALSLVQRPPDTGLSY